MADKPKTETPDDKRAREHQEELDRQARIEAATLSKTRDKDGNPIPLVIP